MSDNPFGEPDDRSAPRPAPGADDSDRTIIRPAPGGRRGAALPPVPLPEDKSLPGMPHPPGSSGPLAVAAAPLLQLLGRLRSTVRQPDPSDLYTRTQAAVRDFDQQARAAGAPSEQVRAVSYALCAALDDAVLNTPWGAASGWTRRGLVAALHPERVGQDWFYDLLVQLQRDPASNLPALEIFYLCLSLGYTGKLRQMAEQERIRAAAGAAILAQRPPPAELSAQWRGIPAPFQTARIGFPVWVAYAAALAACGALFLFVSTALNAASDTQYERMLAAAPAQMPHISRFAPVPPPPPPPEPTALDRLANALKPDIDAGALLLGGTPATPVLRIPTAHGFGSGDASVQPALAAVLAHVAAALQAERGAVQVLAYTDSQPLRTVKYPSAFQLSKARAEAARATLAHMLDAARLSAEGRADADPVAPNSTAEGREQNRRLEIVLHAEQAG